MNDSPRCDTCRVKSTLAPKTLSDVLPYLAPPVELLAAVERWIEKAPQKVDRSIVAYYEKWMALRRDESVPQVDKFDKAYQPTLLEGPVKYE